MGNSADLDETPRMAKSVNLDQTTENGDPDQTAENGKECRP